MRLANSRMRVDLGKRKLLAIALMAISTGGCVSSRSWRPSISAADLSDDESAARTTSGAVPTATGVQPVGFDEFVIDPVLSNADAAEFGDSELQESLPIPIRLTGEVAATPQGVEHYVTLALAGHPSIQAARQRVSAELNRIPQVRALPDPKFNNTFWPIHEQSLQTAAGRVGNQMSLSQTIPWPDKLRTKAAIVSQEVQVARAEVERIEREITEAVRLAYYEVWFATRAIAVIEETGDLIDDLSKVAEARYRSGGTQQDVLRARLESDRLDDQLIGMTKQRQLAQADLAALVQQPVTLSVEAAEDLGLADVPGRLDELIALAEQCNPKLTGLTWEIQRDRQKQRLACLQKYPDLQVGLNWGLVSDSNSVVSPVANGHDQINFSVGTTLPIWRSKIDGGVREAANRTSSTVKRLDAERDALYGKLRRLLAQADAFAEQRDIYQQRIIPRTEDTLKLSFADWRGDRTDFFSLIETYRELLIFETQLARINASLAGTLARIERAVGCE
jgi:cobalt-zinc-cadmium efflux system outer membrane protein